MSALSFASPQLVTAARNAAPQLRNRAARLAQAAFYFVSRHPENTIAQAVRFGRAHGFGAWEFRRAVRAARESLQRRSEEDRQLHRLEVGTFDSPPLHPSLREERLESQGAEKCSLGPLPADAGSRAKSFDLPANRVATARDEHALTQPTPGARAQPCDKRRGSSAVALAVRR
jgi:hypothetical protein